MAKTNTVLIKLVSSADTGFYYVTKKNPRTKPTSSNSRNSIRLCANTSYSKKPR